MLAGSAVDNRPPAAQPTAQSLYEAAQFEASLKCWNPTDEQLAQSAEAKAAMQALLAQLDSSLEGKAVYDAAVEMCGQCRCGQKHKSYDSMRGDFYNGHDGERLRKVAKNCEWQNNSVTKVLNGALPQKRREEWATL